MCETETTSIMSYCFIILFKYFELLNELQLLLLLLLVPSSDSGLFLAPNSQVFFFFLRTHVN